MPETYATRIELPSCLQEFITAVQGYAEIPFFTLGHINDGVLDILLEADDEYQLAVMVCDLADELNTLGYDQDIPRPTLADKEN